MKLHFCFHRPTRIYGSLLAVLATLFLPRVEAASAVAMQISRQTNGSIYVEARGPAGMVYSLQVSNRLMGWRTLDFVHSPSGQAAFRANAAASTEGSHAYRVRLESTNTTVTVTDYHGWTNSILLRNPQVEVVIVPAVGRIMQLRFLDQADGPFWENTGLQGTQPAANSWDTPGSFGGDKAWPSPQTWPWPPPRGFDSMTYTASLTNGVVTMTGPVDATFGTRVVRRISLHPTEPISRVTTTFEKVSGDASQIGVWVITQLKEAERVFLPVPNHSIFPKGYTALGDVPAGLFVSNGLVVLSRDPKAATKIGNDAGALLWVGTNNSLLIESSRRPGAAEAGYPDHGCSAEVYTNPNPTPYLELELLAPLRNLDAGNTAEAVSVYSLFRRTQPTALDEANKILSP